eukprot:9747548-Alexandrium_andersonii.AAC.1
MGAYWIAADVQQHFKQLASVCSGFLRGLSGGLPPSGHPPESASGARLRRAPRALFWGGPGGA